MLCGIEGEIAGDKEEAGHCDGASVGSDCLLENGQDGNGGFEDHVGVGDAVEHCDDEGKRCDEADCNGGDECPGDCGRRVDGVFCQMDSSINTDVHEVWVDHAG